MVRISEEIKEVLVKIIIPAVLVISMGLVVKRKYEGKLTRFTIVSSIFLGIGTCFLLRHLILKYIPEDWIVLVVSMLAIGGEYLIKFLLYKYDWDNFWNGVLKLGKNWIDSKLKK